MGPLEIWFLFLYLVIVFFEMSKCYLSYCLDEDLNEKICLESIIWPGQ